MFSNITNLQPSKLLKKKLKKKVILEELKQLDPPVLVNKQPF